MKLLCRKPSTPLESELFCSWSWGMKALSRSLSIDIGQYAEQVLLLTRLLYLFITSLINPFYSYMLFSVCLYKPQINIITETKWKDKQILGTIVVGALGTIPKCLEERQGIGSQKKKKNYSDKNIVEIVQNAEKCLGDLSRCAATQTQVKDHQNKNRFDKLSGGESEDESRQSKLQHC